MLGFYKLTEKQFEDFQAGKSYAVPTLDPYNLLDKKTAEQELVKNEMLEIFSLEDIKYYTNDLKVLKDKKEKKVYIISNFYDYMI